MTARRTEWRALAAEALARAIAYGLAIIIVPVAWALGLAFLVVSGDWRTRNRRPK